MDNGSGMVSYIFFKRTRKTQSRSDVRCDAQSWCVKQVQPVCEESTAIAELIFLENSKMKRFAI